MLHDNTFDLSVIFGFGTVGPVIGRHLADWFRKHVAGKLTGQVIPDTAGAAGYPIRRTKRVVKDTTETVPDQELAGRRQIEQTGFGMSERPGATEDTDLSIADRAADRGDHAHAEPVDSHGEPPAPASPPAGEKFTPDTRRAWFQRQFDEGNLDPENLAAAKVVIMDENGRVLMLQSPYEGKRTMPGGFVDNGPRKREQPEEAAKREVREELGEELQRAVGIERLLATNKKSPDPEHGRDYPLTDYIYLATFDETTGTRVSGMRFDVDEKEVTGFDFLPPDEAVESAGRKGIDVSAALEAHSSGTTIHLVDGAPPSPSGRDDQIGPE
ncbi:NUDIX domain-containing protein [Nocardia grenadensis]|uniref:NUDIX domain-containing protein n=1 Tax=Nocardia grenadensis TaxID=931537 RepID=UPI003D8AA4E0